jgi:hypothetical protein
MQTELHVATALAKPKQRDTARQLALKTSNNAMGEPLETPNETDIATKQRTSVVRQAIIGVKEKNKAVLAVTPARNGTSALSTELQHTSANPTVTNKNNNTVDTTATGPIMQKRKREVNVPGPIVTIATSLPAGPPKSKCQGCIHGDLLEMTVMESRHIKHCLKPQEFLEEASCAGKCNKTIKNIHQATPKAKLYFCGEMIKGFRAPDTDPCKADLECGLILCVPCHADRGVQCNPERGNSNSTHRRSSCPALQQQTKRSVKSRTH